MTTYTALIEAIAADVHAAYVAAKRAQGVTTLPSRHGTGDLMRPYAVLADVDQEDDRRTVRTVLAGLADRPITEVLGLLRDLRDEVLLSPLRESVQACDPPTAGLAERCANTAAQEDGQR